MKPHHYALSALTTLFSLCDAQDSNAQTYTAAIVQPVSLPDSTALRVRSEAFRIAFAPFMQNPLVKDMHDNLLDHCDQDRVEGLLDFGSITNGADTLNFKVESDSSSLFLQMRDTKKPSLTMNVGFEYNAKRPGEISKFTTSMENKLGNGQIVMEQNAYLLTLSRDNHREEYRHFSQMRTLVQANGSSLLGSFVPERETGIFYPIIHYTGSTNIENCTKMIDITPHGMTEYDECGVSKMQMGKQKSQSKDKLNRFEGLVTQAFGEIGQQVMKPYMDSMRKYFPQ